MKVTHYDRGYVSRLDCVIKGTIYMDQAEWQKAKEIIKRRVKGYTYDHEEKEHTQFMIGNTGTAIIGKKYGLTLHAINYQIIVSK